ncbi:MAG: hypothetical protein ICV60_15515, partial [Pyrinomonadaceae bacterium]|nr:hypothetical protein [Pyrinomonadaceae bacterium]
MNEHSNSISARLRRLMFLCLIAAGAAASLSPFKLADFHAKSAASKDGLWQRFTDSKLTLNVAAQAALFGQAPREFTKAAKEIQVVTTLPMPDGTFARFRIEESPIMEPSLAARFPQIKTYKGKGVDDPTATARIDSTPAGFHAIVLSAHGTVVIAPASQADASAYLSYGSQQAESASFICSTPVAEQAASTAITDKGLRLINKAGSSDSIGETLRTYRLAVAATAEYTQTYGGGSVAGALAAITTVINQVNAVYERDLALRLILINNETSIIFTNSATDGYTSDDADAMQHQNQSVLDARIGANNYDVGHVFDGHSSIGNGRFFFQGRGDVSSVCVNGRKGLGASVFRLLEPSAINAVYVVAHEMGHQFGASHTFNGTTTNDCLNSRVAQTAFEPGTGSTIMAYRGSSGTNVGYFNLCGAEDLHSTDLYFHIASVSQIVNYTSGGGGASCAGLISTGNNPPTIDAGPDYTIPRGTPFTLTASASDVDGDALTYCWEELDLGAPSPPSTDDGSRPIFRSFAPVSSPSRTFPQLSDILSSTATLGESLPVTTRTMRFQATVRDNHSGGGGGSTDTMFVNVAASSGPFVINEPVAATNWPAGSTRTVMWDVANTSNAPVGCTSVRILLSTDGGLSFPFVLAASVPNNGAANINVPNVQTTTARVKVEALGNIFFDISDANFSITGAAASTIQLSAQSYSFNEGTINTAQSFGALSVDVTRTDTSSAATVQFATSDQSGGNECNQATGQASQRCDYAQQAGTLRFATGEGSKQIQIPIVNDGYLEGDEVFTLRLQNPTGATLGSISQAAVTIVDDSGDATPTTSANNPYLSIPFFVRLNYLDFLSREPDASGFTDWTTVLNNCGSQQGFLGAPF